jgi:hypothetical protein
MARLLCYRLRVLQSCEDSERLEGTLDHQSSEGRGSESDTEDDSEHDEDSDGDGGSDSDIQPVVDVFKDARRLYPWQGRQKDLLRRVREGIDNGWDKKSQLKALLDFYESLIFQHVRGDTFKSAILHFLAALGIDEETRRLRQAT